MKKSLTKLLALTPRLLIVVIIGLYLATSTPTYSQTTAKVEETKVVVPELPPSPTIEVKIETQEETVAFTTKTVFSKTRAQGVNVVTNQGRAGKRVITHEVTFTDGVETSRNQIKTEVVIQPINKIITKGTLPALDPNASKPAPPIIYTGRKKMPKVNFDQPARLVSPKPQPQPEPRVIQVQPILPKPLY